MGWDEILRQSPLILRVTELEPPGDFGTRVSLYSIRYRSDDCEVEGYAAFPKGAAAPLEAVIFNRGGNREFGSLRPLVLCRYAQRGFAVLGSQYRGNCGGTGREEFGGADLNDVLHLIDLAMTLPGVVHSGVYMAGHSRGGMMTYLACAKDPRIRAAAICAGLADCFVMYDRFHDGEYDMHQDMEELIGGSPAQLPEAYTARSAVCWAEKIKPPLLICQGTNDWRVVPEQAYHMARELQRCGKEYALKIYEGADHSLKGTTLLDDVTAWFRAHPLP